MVKCYDIDPQTDRSVKHVFSAGAPLLSMCGLITLPKLCEDGL